MPIHADLFHIVKDAAGSTRHIELPAACTGAAILEVTATLDEVVRTVRVGKQSGRVVVAVTVTRI